MNDLLQRFSPEQQNILKKLRAELKLSFSNNRSFLTYIYEILRRESPLDFDVLIKELNIPAILENKNVQGKKKGEKIIDILFARRFPETAELIKNGEFNV
jgi:hypothetical protein